MSGLLTIVKFAICSHVSMLSGLLRIGQVCLLLSGLLIVVRFANCCQVLIIVVRFAYCVRFVNCTEHTEHTLYIQK